MTIRFFSPVVPNQQIGDSYEYEGGLLDLLRHQERGHTLEEKQADFQIVLNGAVVPLSQYKYTYINIHDDLKIIIAPKGGIVKAIGGLLSGIFNVVFGLFGINQGGRGGASSRGFTQGERMEASSLRANIPGQGASVPELFGYVRHFCYMLSEIRKVYVNLREQVMYVTLHVSIGHMHDVRPYLGTTPLWEMGGTEYWVHNPGDNLSGHEPAQLWHNSPAVGGTSAGTAGIVLSVDVAETINVNPGSYLFNGLEITRTSGVWPPGWGNGTVVNVLYPRTYQRAREQIGSWIGTGYRTIYTGYFGHTELGQDVFFPWNAEVITDHGGGVKSLVFWLPETETDDRIYKDDGPDGITPIVEAYGSVIQWTVSSVNGNTLTLFPNNGLIFESNETVQSSEVNYLRGELYGEYTSGFVVTPNGIKTQLVEYDTMFPQGLCYMSDSGDVQSRSVTVETEFSDEAGIVPTVTVTRTYTAATRDQIGFTEQFAYAAAARCRVRRRRVGVGSQTPNVVDETNWSGLKTRLPDKTSYPGWTTLTVKLKTGNQLGAQSENQINIYGTRMLPTLQDDFTLSGLVPTRDISAAAIRVASAGGYNLDAWHRDILHLHKTYWSPRSEFFDYAMDGTTIQTAVNMILNAGMSQLTMKNGYLAPVRDIPRTAFVQGFSPQNGATEFLETTTHHRSDDNDGYLIEYTDADTWEVMTVRCLAPNSLGVRLKKEKVPGVTSRVIAYRIGMKKALSDYYRRTAHKFKTNASGLNAFYMDYVSVITSLRNWGQSFKLLHLEQNGDKALLVLSERIVFESISPPYVAGVRGRKGEVLGPFPARLIDDLTIEISGLTSPLRQPTLDEELPDVYFGEEGRLSHAALVQTVNPSGLRSAEIETINYDERVYQYDDAYPTE